MNKKELGLLIKKRRKLLNISQKELADISGVALRKLVDIENAKANPTVDTLMKIMDTLGLQFDVRAKS